VIPYLLLDASASDKLADAAEQLAAELRFARDVRYERWTDESYYLTAGIAELRLLALLLRRTPIAQQRLAQHIIERWRERLLIGSRQFDA
jgi:hypothetical protein